ncbi:MAG: guanylate kinase [Bryobacteraceae bacterium]|nr:guanylate kinase [Bryobacteraceae bacterium]
MTNVFIVSAPSGSGKSTLLRRVLAEDDRLLFSISYTTRAPRGVEIQGESYHYIPRREFEERASRGEFLEWAEVFGNYYGTHRFYYDRALATGRDLVLDIDVQGARQLRSKVPEAISIFILAPSREILEQRLRSRSEDPDEVIERRLREAAEEIRNYHDYDYVVVNREVDRSAADLAAVFRVQRLRRTRMEDEIKPILATFAESFPKKAGQQP